MTTDTLRRLQALRGQPRPVSALAALAQVQGDLQTVIEAVLDLADGGDAPARPVESAESAEPVTEEPAIGEQVTDRDGYVWQRFVVGWCWWRGQVGTWSSHPRTWDYVRYSFGPLRPTTDDDRRRVGLPVREDASPEPVEAAESDAQPEEVPEDPEAEIGPEVGAQGRIGWLRVRPDDDCRHAAREIPGGWTDVDIEDDRPWLAEDWPDAKFTPIRALADDEVAVKREDLLGVLRRVSPSPAADRLRAVLEAGEDA